ncbi:MAG: hypothetical protein QOD95_3038 [Gammaproteobacteria bacterium]|jgi:hypothetical protein|nr:hypothetical protein [Gammaproteobacteria bacterium]
MHYLLFYEFVPDYVTRRAAFRFAHLVTRWHIREWTTVVGEDATTPVRPGTP